MRKIEFLSILLIVLSFSLMGQTKWYNPQNENKNVIAGRHWSNELQNTYSRLPRQARNSLSPKHWEYAQNSAGLSIQFKTNASSITVKYSFDGETTMPHMPATGVSGVDLYMNIDGEDAWCRGNWKFSKNSATYHFNELSNDPNTETLFTLYLPLYVSVLYLEIGVNSNNRFEFIEVSKQKPIVCYGTSIVQGACASRPAMAWSNILHRNLNVPVINLGFSSHGQLDKPMFELMSEIDAATFIIDCMPNMARDRNKYIFQRVIDGVEILRSKSNAPILLAEHCGYMNKGTSEEAKTAFENANRELRKAYDELKKRGVKNLHYITSKEFAFTSNSQVDGVHPNDIGMNQYATAYEKQLQRILKQRRFWLK